MKQVNWGIIGAGDIVRKRIAPAMIESELCGLAAVSRGRADLAAEFAREFGIARAYADVASLVADPAVDAVYVASPVYLHAEHSVAAAQAGKHVLVEKPMALTADECDRIIEAAAKAGVKLGVAYYRRFYPVITRVRQIIESGEIGRPVVAQINAFEAFNPGADHPRRWFIEKEKSGGGPMMDFGCHRLEILTYLFGPVASMESMISNVVSEREVEDTAAVLLRFDSGTTGSLTVTHAVRESADTLDIFCTDGSIHIPSLNSGEIRVLTASGTRTEAHPPDKNFHLPLIEDFARAVIEDREPAVGGGTGRTIAVLEDRIYSR
jgi:predicted dehydrogenase